jgi:hypothetical protein
MSEEDKKEETESVAKESDKTTSIQKSESLRTRDKFMNLRINRDTEN